MDLLNDDRLSDELREEYGKKFKELEIWSWNSWELGTHLILI
jgi:hypothetical protein